MPDTHHPHHMTKAAEIAILDNAIKALGKDSYLGPWLASVRDQVESLVRSDIFPEINIDQAARDCLDLRAENKRTNDSLILSAKSSAASIKARAEQEAEQALRDARLRIQSQHTTIRAAINALETVLNP